MQRYEKLLLGVEAETLTFLLSLIEGKVLGEQSGDSNVQIYLVEKIDNDYYMENIYNLIRVSHFTNSRIQ
jgi:hypothetical protein